MNLDRIRDRTRLTRAQAAAIWRVDPTTGLLHWLPGSGRTGVAGVAGPNKPPYAYLHVLWDGFAFSAHRLVWLLCAGQWPEFFIDHINGDRHDNRLVNLRDVPHRVNQLNQSHHRLGIKKADYRRTAANCSVTQKSQKRYEEAPSRYEEAVTPRARTPFLTEGKLRRNAVTQDVTLQADGVTRDMDGLKPSTSREAAGKGQGKANSTQRTDIAKSVLEIARRVLAGQKAGRVFPAGTVEWAEQIVKTNRTRTFKPPGRPPKMPGGCYAQVCGYLADNTGSIVTIAEAISYSERSVETAITSLRKESSPLLARVVDGRFTLRTDANRPKPRKRIPKKEGPRLGGPIQDVAIANRSPLEAAWGLAMGVLG